MRLNNRAMIAAAALVGCVGAAPQSAPLSPGASDGPPPATGPTGTSDRGADRYDEVGYAAVAPGSGYIASVRGVAPGGYVEITALDDGRSTLALVTPGEPPTGAVATVSSTAAAAMGLNDRSPIRVRRVSAAPADQAALANGRAPGSRLDAPPALLAGLRARLGRPSPAPAPALLPARSASPAPRRAIATPKPAPPAVVKAAAPRGPGYYVQVAAFGSLDRATALARSIGGSIAPLGSLYRVRLGPFATTNAAAKARNDAAARGYDGARVVQENNR